MNVAAIWDSLVLLLLLTCTKVSERGKRPHGEWCCHMVIGVCP